MISINEIFLYTFVVCTTFYIVYLHNQYHLVPMLTDKLDLAAIDMTTLDKLAEEKTKYRSLHTKTYELLEIRDRVWLHHHTTKEWHMQATGLHPRAGGSYFIQADNGKEAKSTSDGAFFASGQ